MAHIQVLSREIDPETEEGQALLASAHSKRQRAHCLCCDRKPELYITHIGDDRFILKRMPGTGPDHASHCTSFEPPEGVSGLGPLVGSAITFTGNGEVALKVDFSLTIRGSRVLPPAPPNSATLPEASAPQRRLSLTSLLHFLWSEAELARWSPGFEGKRGWGLIRHLLYSAARGKTTKALTLSDRLHVPEPFEKDAVAAIRGRRETFLRSLQVERGTAQPVGILIAEYKSHEKGRIGYRFTFKHMADTPFYAEADLASRFDRAFADHLRLADLMPHLRMVAIATFCVDRAGLPKLLEIGLMPTTEYWIPIETSRDIELANRLVAERRSFLRPLRYNLTRATVLPSALLTDAGDHPVRLYLDDPYDSQGPEDVVSANSDVGFERQAARTVEEIDKWPLWYWPLGHECPALPDLARAGANAAGNGEVPKRRLAYR